MMKHYNQNRNIWMVQSTQELGHKKRWRNLFAISTVTTIAFCCVGLATFQIAITMAKPFT